MRVLKKLYYALVFIGHLAVAFAAKRATPRVSLAMLVLAAQWADTLWPVLVALGVEEVRIAPGDTAFTPLEFVSYPYSHSLLMLTAWGVAVGLAYRGVAGGRGTVLALIGLVVSHWVLDYVTHRPDMPLYPGGSRFGLGLWNSVPGTLAVEVPMYVLGVWVYMRSTRARDRIGRWAFPSLAAFLFVAYVGNVMSGAPPDVMAIAIAGIVGAVVLTAWAWWADRHRDYIVSS